MHWNFLRFLDESFISDRVTCLVVWLHLIFEEFNAVFHLTWEGWYIYIYIYIYTGSIGARCVTSLPPRRFRWSAGAAGRSSPNRVPAPYFNEGRPLWGRAVYTRYTVSVSPQCPQEIGLPTLPRTVFQGAAISSEHTSQFLPPGNVAELRCSPPLQGSLEQLVRLSPAGVPFQNTKLAALITPEASLQRLVPLVDYLAAWKLLPSLSPWVMHTVERGYRIQLGSPPPRFNGVYPTLVGPEQALVMEQEVEYSLEEGGHQGGPSSRKRVRFLQPVLHSSQEGWRVASHFRSASVEPLSQQTEFHVAHTQTGISDQIRGLVCRSKRRRLPNLHSSHSQGVPEVCFRGRSLPVSGSSLQPSTLTTHFYKVCGCCVSSVAATRHPHTQLHQRLVDSRSIRAGGGSTSRCCSRSVESVGVKTERQEECAFSITENHLSWCGVRFNHDAGTYVPCSDRVDPHRSQESEGRPVTHCQAVSEAAGSDGSCVQCDTYWPAVHETPAGVAQD